MHSFISAPHEVVEINVDIDNFVQNATRPAEMNATTTNFGGNFRINFVTCEWGCNRIISVKHCYASCA